MIRFRLAYLIQRRALGGVYLTSALDLTLFTPIYVSLLLGGGYGYLTGEHGLALDNLVRVRPITHYSSFCVSSSHRLLWSQQAGRS